MIRILVTGSRTWTDDDAITTALDDAVGDTPAHQVVLVHGACPSGADEIADIHATKRRWTVERHPADWARHGRSRAGHVRNQRMVALGADVVIAFIRDQSPGASTCLAKARQRGLRTVVWRQDTEQTWLDTGPTTVAAIHPGQGGLF